MTGLVLALLYSGWQYLHGVPVGTFYPAATNFLFWWYVVMAVIVGLFYIGVTLLLSLGLMASGAESGGIVGGLLGLTIGGGGSHSDTADQLPVEFWLPAYRRRTSSWCLCWRPLGRCPLGLRRPARPRWHFGGQLPHQLVLQQKELATFAREKPPKGISQGRFFHA